MNSHPYLTSMPQNALERRPKQFQRVAAKATEGEVGEELKEMPSVRNRSSTLLPEPSEAEKENKLQTVRKRYRCEDYMETQELKLQAMERALDGDSNKQKQATQPAQSKEQDKQIEYFKSEQYKKYLQALTETHSKYDLLKGIKENRNNNVYLGKGDRKQYIQNIIKTKEVLPRVCLPKFENVQQKVEEVQPKANKKQEHQNVGKTEIKSKYIDEESPIKCTPVFETMEKREKINETIGLQPVCMQRKQKEQDQQNTKNTKHAAYKHSFPLQTNNHVPKQKTPQKKQPQHITTAYAKHTKQQKYMQINTERYPPRKDKSTKKPTLRYKIQEKQNSPTIILTPQSSKHYSISSSPQKSQDINIYDVSFKIQKPNASKQTYRQPKSPLPQKKAKPLTQRQQEKVYHHAEPTRHRIFTQWNDTNLHYSHTNSTATKAQPQKPHKISLISKSKLKL